jgi:hypothetical protein
MTRHDMTHDSTRQQTTADDSRRQQTTAHLHITVGCTETTLAEYTGPVVIARVAAA